MLRRNQECMLSSFVLIHRNNAYGIAAAKLNFAVQRSI